MGDEEVDEAVAMCNWGGMEGRRARGGTPRECSSCFLSVSLLILRGEGEV